MHTFLIRNHYAATLRWFVQVYPLCAGGQTPSTSSSMILLCFLVVFYMNVKHAFIMAMRKTYTCNLQSAYHMQCVLYSFSSSHFLLCGCMFMYLLHRSLCGIQRSDCCIQYFSYSNLCEWREQHAISLHGNTVRYK